MLDIDWLDDLGLQFPPGRYTYTSASGQVALVLDTVAFDFHVDAAPDADPSELEWLLDKIVFANGLELLSDEEAEPETLDNGWTRIYATPVEASEDLVVEPSLPAVDDRGEVVQPHRKLGGVIGATAFAAAVSLAVHAQPIMEVVAA